MTRWTSWTLCKLATFLLYAAFVSAAPPPRVELSALRDFGYAMGDLIEHTIDVTVPADNSLETEFLPRPGTLDEWLDIRAVDWTRRDESGGAHYRIRVAYQLFKGVRTNERATVPPLPLRFRGSEPLEVEAPAWEFTITPLIPPQLADENVAIRGPMAAVPEPTAGHRHRLAAFFVGSLAVLGFMVWRRLDLRRRARPFARTLREMKKRLRATPAPAAYRDAVRLLHRALDETAGHTVFAGQIDQFLAHHPAFAELREDLAAFFALSQRLFFIAPETPIPDDYPAGRLEDLCRRCARAERRRR